LLGYKLTLCLAFNLVIPYSSQQGEGIKSNSFYTLQLAAVRFIVIREEDDHFLGASSWCTFWV
jgi:hypothetical protein